MRQFPKPGRRILRGPAKSPQRTAGHRPSLARCSPSAVRRLLSARLHSPSPAVCCSPLAARGLSLVACVYCSPSAARRSLPAPPRLPLAVCCPWFVSCCLCLLPALRCPPFAARRPPSAARCLLPVVCRLLPVPTVRPPLPATLCPSSVNLCLSFATLRSPFASRHRCPSPQFAARKQPPRGSIPLRQTRFCPDMR